MLLLLLIIILQFDPPHNRLNTRFFKVKPTLRNVRDWDDIFVRWSQVCKGFFGSLMKEIDYFYVGECDLDFIFCFITSIFKSLVILNSEWLSPVRFIHKSHHFIL